MMKIINSVIVALLLCGSAWANDGFYVVDTDTGTSTYYQRYNNVFYRSGGDPGPFYRERCKPDSERFPLLHKLLTEGLD